MVVALVVSEGESESGSTFSLKYFQRKKEKKESASCSGGFKRSQVFLEKYYLIGGMNRNDDGDN
jgi:hypothetical protein